MSYSRWQKNTGSDHSFNEHQLFDVYFREMNIFHLKTTQLTPMPGAVAGDIDAAVLLFAILIFCVSALFDKSLAFGVSFDSVACPHAKSN